jgi:uncharacterized protein YlzI (FlbEa/FlbD family)
VALVKLSLYSSATENGTPNWVNAAHIESMHLTRVTTREHGDVACVGIKLASGATMTVIEPVEDVVARINGALDAHGGR